MEVDPKKIQEFMENLPKNKVLLAKDLVVEPSVSEIECDFCKLIPVDPLECDKCEKIFCGSCFDENQKSKSGPKSDKCPKYHEFCGKKRLNSNIENWILKKMKFSHSCEEYCAKKITRK